VGSPLETREANTMNTTSKKELEKPKGEGWVRAYGNHGERTVERPKDPCSWCGCTTFVESTYDWPYCESCKGK
jgi:hypothetical protein